MNRPSREASVEMTFHSGSNHDPLSQKLLIIILIKLCFFLQNNRIETKILFPIYRVGFKLKLSNLTTLNVDIEDILACRAIHGMSKKLWTKQIVS